MFGRILEISRKDRDKYVVNISIVNGWVLSKEVYDSDLQSLVDSINEVRGLNQIMKLFNCDEKQAIQLRKNWGEDGTRPDNDCKDCKFKRIECYKCRFVCQSPLEQAMFLEFRKRGIDVILQRRIRKDGTYYDYPKKVDGNTILTVPDFFIENEKAKVCIYADGATYHYSNENQGIRDRTIDIALQNLGYKVVRYLGSQIRNDVEKVVDSVMMAVEGQTINETLEITNENSVQNPFKPKGYCDF